MKRFLFWLIAVSIIGALCCSCSDTPLTVQSYVQILLKQQKQLPDLGSSNFEEELKEYKKALSTLLKASRLDRRNPKVYYNLSMVYIATGKTAKAIQYLKKAKSLCDSDDTLLIQKIDKIYEKIRG